MRLSRIHEALDDKDEFGNIKVIAGYYKDDKTLYIFDNGGKLYGGNKGYKIRTPDGRMIPLYSPYSNDAPANESYPYGVAISRAFIGGWKRFTPEIEAEWQQTMDNLKEDLDDTDTFEKSNGCLYCFNQSVSIEAHEPMNQEEFHEAHTAARQTGLKAGPYNTPEYKAAYSRVMREHGYEYYQPAGNPLHGTAYLPYWKRI